MDTEQAQPALVPVRKLLRAHLLSIPLNLAIVGLSLTGAMSDGGWAALLIILCGVSMLIEVQAIRASVAMLEQLGRSKPAWLDPFQFFALASGPVYVALGTWLLFRR